MSDFENSLRLSAVYMESRAAGASLAADPYWPKWDSPWWHITIWFELGMADRIPPLVLSQFLDTCRTHYLDFFPFLESEVPAGKDPLRHVACHCALATVFRIATAAGLDPDHEIPWARSWFLKYQLPDGGWNCDEAAYLRPTPKSSIVSTVPVLEALLEGTRRPFTPAEISALRAGAGYLLAHRLFRRRESGEIINQAWTNLCFPRFYEYDVLRGLAFLCRLEERLGQQIISGEAEEAVEMVKKAIDPETGHPIIGRRAWAGAKTRFQAADGIWSTGKPAASFPLLEAVGLPGAPCGFLAPDLAVVRKRFAIA